MLLFIIIIGLIIACYQYVTGKQDKARQSFIAVAIVGGLWFAVWFIYALILATE